MQDLSFRFMLAMITAAWLLPGNGHTANRGKPSKNKTHTTVSSKNPQAPLPPLIQRWSRRMSPGDKVALLPDGKTLFVRTRELVALDSGTGQASWRALLSPHAPWALNMILRKGILFTTDEQMTANRIQGSAVALEPGSGKRKWASPLKGTASTPPLYYQGLVFFFTMFRNSKKGGGNPGGALVALEADGGKGKWRREFSLAPILSPVLAAGNICLATPDGKLSAFDALSGETKWSLVLGRTFLGNPHSLGQTLYVVFSKATKHYLAAIDAEKGKVKWRASLPKIKAALLTASPASVLLGNGLGLLSAFHPDQGKLQWRRTLEDRLSAMVARENIVYGLTDHGCLAALEPLKGNVLWRHGIGAGGRLALTKNLVFAATTRGEVHAFATGLRSVRSGKPAVITGRVFDMRGQAVKKARVQVSSFFTHTDQQGRFRLTLPYQGNICLRARLESLYRIFRVKKIIKVQLGKFYFITLRGNYLEKG